jgi:hypothetical protein
MEEGPADDTAPAKPSPALPTPAPAVAPRWSSSADDVVLVRDERGVILAPEASD